MANTGVPGECVWARGLTDASTACRYDSAPRVRDMAGPLTPTQLETLQWIAEGRADGDAPNPRRTSARSLYAKGLVVVRGRGATWRATMTDLGNEWLENGGRPSARPAPEVPPKPRQAPRPAAEEAPSQGRHRSSGSSGVSPK